MVATFVDYLACSFLGLWLVAFVLQFLICIDPAELRAELENPRPERWQVVLSWLLLASLAWAIWRAAR